ncbi:hemerythrin family protein [Azospirillum sp. RWY-5-1]|uniref:Hemerythrin family protein n=1 Tax=Azospirillum oleiclasticum TaxID=2735135 RepID=A0ABX2T1H2_9PROT|nr:bacteriohemerythrin [Azospirillum oleiclasticum]NYZ10999.1 hemerythrin family protein [Azospirillum oleiclasticum]NYZ18161.1 hemerythrin family protein [Azospirillum oleiclasticum]
MNYVAWDSSMSVGMDVLDSDHKQLIGMFNGLLQKGIADRDRDDLRALLDELTDYTAGHFAREEEAMERGGFPDLESHLAAHRYFTDEIAKLKESFNSSHTVMLRIDLVLLLKDWFIEHIQTVDAQYRPYVHAPTDDMPAGA